MRSRSVTAVTYPFVVDASRIFPGSHSHGLILSCARAGSPFSTFREAEDAYVGSMAIDDARVYWVLSGTGSVHSCSAAEPTCAAAKTELRASDLEDAPARMVKYERGLLLVGTETMLFACEPPACIVTLRVVAREPQLAVGLALAGTTFAADDASIYYVASDPGPDGGPLSHRILRVAR